MSNNKESPNTEYRIVVRFGDELLQAGFTAIPNLVLRHYVALGITPTEMMFIVHIWQYWWNEKDPYPSLRTIADRMGISWRNAQRYVASLKQKRVLVVAPRFAAGLGQMTNEYDFSPLTQRVLAQEGDAAKTPPTNMSGAPTTNPSWGGATNPSWAPTTRMSSEEYEPESYADKSDEVSSKERNSSFFLSNTGPKRRYVDNSGGARTAEPDPDGTVAPSGWARAAQVAETLRPQALMPGRTNSSGRGRPPKAPDYLATTMEELSRKLHDDNPRSSLTRAVKLWKAAGIPEDKFVHRLHEAKSITQQQGNVKGKPASTDTQLVNRMPYFFAVVEDLVGLREGRET